MAEITNIKDIAWFKLSNYDFLYDLPTHILEGQVLLHLEYLRYQKMDLGFYGLGALGERISSDVNQRMDKQWLQISKGDAFLGAESINDDWGFEEGDFKNLLDYSTAISGQSVYSAIFNSTLLKQKGLVPDVSDIAAGDIDLFLKSNFPSFPHPEKVTIEIDLKNHTNREIVSQLIMLLEPWREQLNIPEPKGIKIKRADHYNKVLEYKIIPLIDLKRWEALTGNTINPRIIVNLLYPDNFKLDFSRTVMGTYQDIIDNNLRDAFPKKELNI